MKFVLVLLVVGVALWVLLGRQSRRGRGGQGREPGSARAQPAAADDGAPQQMVACAHCGVQFPAAEAVRHEGHAYCSPDHCKAGPRGS